jgi:spore coat protein A, manganese oxidase
MGLSRRDMLKMSLAGSAALILPMEQFAVTGPRMSRRMPANMLPAPFKRNFVRAPVAQPVCSTDTTDYYQLTLRSEQAEILPGRSTEIWGYDGIAPGPTIVQRRGRETVVRAINQIENPRHVHSSVHLHGNASLPQYDGYADDVTRPGEFKDYHYPNDQPARTLWYHDHGVHHTALNAYMGCAAFYITHDDHELSLPIPHGQYDVPVVLRDAIFSKNGSLIFDHQDHSSLHGDVILANGRPWPRMRVERRKYRFRFLNAATSRGFKLALSTGEPLTVIGTDGGLMPAPVQTQSLRIGSAERYEVVIDFSKYNVGQQVELRNLGLPNNPQFANTDKVMRFDVVAEPTSVQNNEVPAVLAPDNEVMQLSSDQAVRTRAMDFKRSNGMWTINGRTWHQVEASNYTSTLANPGLNDVEIWRFTNSSGGWFHPVHVHLVDFKLLDRNGRAPFPYERGPKDVAYVGEGESVRVLAKFGPNEGRYMIHCHNLVHEDHDMMHQFQVGGSGPDPVHAAAAKPVSSMSPLC